MNSCGSTSNFYSFSRTLMSDQYYIRIRGEVRGPLNREQIVAQIRRKRLGRHHELSTDAVTWQKAGEIADLFEPVVSAREVPVEPEPVVAATDIYAASSYDEVEGNSPGTEWYYSKGGNKLGPVSASDIQMWLGSGRLDASDLVWNESFDNWLPAGDLPQFSGSIVSKQKKSKLGEMPKAGFLEVFLGTSKAASLPGDSIHKYPSLTRYLRIAEESTRISFILSLLISFSAWVYFVGQSVSEEDWFRVTGLSIFGPVFVTILWLLFITCMAGLELIRVVIKIEDNTAH